MPPLVSVITPTYGDPTSLLTRCIPSVERQTYPDVEHIVVVDGPNALPPEESPTRRVVHLGRRWHEFTPEPSWGTMARLVASGLARGDYIAYNDHDDELLPFHVEHLVHLLETTGSDWIFSKMGVVHRNHLLFEVGDGQPRWKAISTQMLLHRAEMFHVANWDPYCRHARMTLPRNERRHATYSSDWDLVARWLRARARWTFLPEVTIHHYHETDDAGSLDRFFDAQGNLLAKDAVTAGPSHADAQMPAASPPRPRPPTRASAKKRSKRKRGR